MTMSNSFYMTLHPYANSGASDNAHPLSKIPGLLYDTIRKVAKATQAPNEMVATSVLSAAALSTQSLYVIKHATLGVIPVSAWFCIVAQSGERKSSVDRLTQEGIRNFESASKAAYKEKSIEYKIKKELWEAEKRRTLSHEKRSNNSLVNNQDLNNRLLALERQKPIEPQSGQILFADTTVPALLEQIPQENASIGLFSDEGGVLIRGHALQKLPILNQIWDGSTVVVNRKGEPSRHIKNPKLSMSIMVQPELAISFFRKNDALARNSGFLARTLFCNPPSTQGTRKLAFNDNREKANEIDISDFHKKCYEYLNNSANGEGKVLNLSSAAHMQWMNYYNYIEHEQNSGRKYEIVRDAASKSAQQALRLAGVIHAFNCPDNEINDDTMLVACEIANYYLDEFLKFIIEGNQQSLADDARQLHQWILMKKNNHGFSIVIRKNEVLQCAPNNLRTPKGRVNAAIGYLIEKKFIHLNDRYGTKYLEVSRFSHSGI